MSKHQKTREKMGRVPTPTDVRWDDLVGLLTSLGFSEMQGSGSRRKFFHEQTKALIILHEPHPQPIVKAPYVRYVMQCLNDHNL